MNRQRIVAAFLLEDVAARHLIGLVVLFCWMTVWSWGCLEVSSADPQAWRLPLGIGAGTLAIIGVFGYNVTKKDDLPLGTRVVRGVILAMTSTRPRCLGYIAIGTVLIWLSYRSLTGSIQSVYCNEKEILQWTVIGPERSRTCGTDIMQIWYPFKTPEIKVLDRNDRSLRGYCRIGDHGYVDCLKPEPQSGGSISQPSTKKELVIALFNGGDLQFTRSISAAFSERLQRLANEARIDVRTIWATGPALLPSDARGHDEWLHQIDYVCGSLRRAEQNRLFGRHWNTGIISHQHLERSPKNECERFHFFGSDRSGRYRSGYQSTSAEDIGTCRWRALRIWGSRFLRHRGNAVSSRSNADLRF